MAITYTTEFECPPAHLWTFLHEPEKQKLWMKGLVENNSTSEGPTKVGSTFHMKIKEGGKVADYNGEVTGYDPPRHLGIRIWGGGLPGGCKIHANYRLTDLGGRTRLDYVCDMEMEKIGFFMRLMMPLFMLFGKMQLRGFMKTLKRLAEAPA